MEYEMLKRIVADELRVDPAYIRPESAFVEDLGADSIEVFHIIMRIEEEFDMEVDDEKAMKTVTVGDAARLIKETLAL